jgi:hypothetical protein
MMKKNCKPLNSEELLLDGNRYKEYQVGWKK